MMFRQEVTRLSCDSKADSELRLVFSVNRLVDNGLTRLRPETDTFESQGNLTFPCERM